MNELSKLLELFKYQKIWEKDKEWKISEHKKVLRKNFNEKKKKKSYQLSSNDLQP